MKLETEELLNEIIYKDKEKLILDYNVFELYNYRVTKPSIDYLIEFKISPKQIFYNGLGSLSELPLSNNKKDSIIEATKEMFNNNDKNRTIYELLFQGISKIVCDKLVENNITINNIVELDIHSLKKNYEIGYAMAEKLKNAIKKNNEIILEQNRSVDTSQMLINILMECTREKEISFYDFKQLSKKSESYPFENFDFDYEKIMIKKQLTMNMYGIRYKFISFKDYVNQNYKEKIAEIIIKRYSGMTLEKIAKGYGLTRERVRQICMKINLGNIEEIFEEDKYKIIFEKYKWDIKMFCMIFEENEFTYNYLKDKYVVGTEPLNSILNDDYFTEIQKNIYKTNNKIIVTSDGTCIRNHYEFFKKFLVKYASNEIDIESLTEKYNNEVDLYLELELDKLNQRSLEGRLSNCDFAFFSGNHMVRYYDFNNLQEDSINQLKELIELSDGFYSTDYIFKNNINLMQELDIRSSNELHNILKLKIDDDENNVYFIRMPNFLVGYTSKDEFLLDKLKEFSPININEFIEMLYEDYGHKKNTMLSYLTSNFNVHLNNNTFNVVSKKLDDLQIERLKQHLINPIYSLEYLERFLKDNNYEDINEIITNYNLNFIGYKLKNGFIISAEYSGVYQYFDMISEREDIVKLDDDLVKSAVIYNSLNYYCAENKLFKISNTIYITKRKMNSIGIKEEDIVKFRMDVRERYFDCDYFSVNNIIDELDVNLFVSKGLTTSFIENLIYSIPEVHTLRIDNNRLFTFKKGNISIKGFMIDMIYKYRNISLYSLNCEIEKNYQIKVSEEKLRGYLYGTDIFYSNIMNKIYLDKNDYYEEVYNEE